MKTKLMVAGRPMVPRSRPKKLKTPAVRAWKRVFHVALIDFMTLMNIPFDSGPNVVIVVPITEF